MKHIGHIDINTGEAAHRSAASLYETMPDYTPTDYVSCSVAEAMAQAICTYVFKTLSDYFFNLKYTDRYII